MIEPKFTPTPWEVKFSMCEDMTFASIETENHKTIAEVFLNDNEDEQEANAYLLKAAPDMYEALQKIQEVELAIAQEHRVQAEDSEIYCIAEKALRKARNESEEI